MGEPMEVTHVISIDDLTDNVLDNVFASLEESDRRNAIQACRRFRHVFDASPRLLSSCFATLKDVHDCIAWLRRHSHSVSYLNVDPDMPDYLSLQMVAVAAERLTNLVINVNKPLKIAGAGLPRLKYLDVELGPRVRILEVLKAASTLPALEYLRVDSTREAEEHCQLPRELTERGALRALVLTKQTHSSGRAPSRLTLGPSLEQLSGLTELVASNLLVQELPRCVSTLTGLHALALTGVPHSADVAPSVVLHDDCLACLCNLRIVQLEYCGLWQVPEGLLGLTTMEKLSLEGNRLAALPERIGELTNLQALVLGHNMTLAALPSSLSNLTSLTELDLHSCEFSDVPEPVRLLPSLLDLKLSYNLLRDLPGGRYLSGLTRLDLGANMLEELPTALRDAPELRELLIDEQHVEEEDAPPPPAFQHQVGVEGNTHWVVLLTDKTAALLLEWHPKLEVLAAVERGRELKGGSEALRDMWFDDNTFDAALAMLRGRGIEVQ